MGGMVRRLFSIGVELGSLDGFLGRRSGAVHEIEGGFSFHISGFGMVFCRFQMFRA